AFHRTVTVPPYVACSAKPCGTGLPRSPRSPDHWVAQGPDGTNRDLDHITVLQPPWRRARGAHTGRGPGQDHVSRLERASLADPRDELRHREHELRCGR